MALTASELTTVLVGETPDTALVWPEVGMELMLIRPVPALVTLLIGIDPALVPALTASELTTVLVGEELDRPEVGNVPDATLDAMPDPPEAGIEPTMLVVGEVPDRALRA